MYSISPATWPTSLICDRNSVPLSWAKYVFTYHSWHQTVCYRILVSPHATMLIFKFYRLAPWNLIPWNNWFNYYGKTSGFSMNAASTQFLKLLNSLSLCLIQFFNTNHQGSILLKSGDSGGKYEISNPRLATNSSI